MRTAVKEMIDTPARGALVVVLVSSIVIWIWIWIYRQQQWQRMEPKEWLLLGATLESLRNLT